MPKAVSGVWGQHSQFGSSIESVEPTLFKNNMYTLCTIQLYWTQKTTVNNTQMLIYAMFTYTYPKNSPCVLLIPYMEHVECHVPTMLGSNTLLYTTNFLVLFSTTACRLSGQGCSSASSDFTVPTGYKEWRIHSFSCGKSNMFLWWNINKVVGHPIYFVGFIYKEPSSPNTHLVGYISIYLYIYISI